MQTVLRGIMQRSGDRVRVTARRVNSSCTHPRRWLIRADETLEGRTLAPVVTDLPPPLEPR